jgi:hypothetical protein
MLFLSIFVILTIIYFFLHYISCNISSLCIFALFSVFMCHFSLRLILLSTFFILFSLFPGSNSSLLSFIFSAHFSPSHPQPCTCLYFTHRLPLSSLLLKFNLPFLWFVLSESFAVLGALFHITATAIAILEDSSFLPDVLGTIAVCLSVSRLKPLHHRLAGRLDFIWSCYYNSVL